MCGGGSPPPSPTPAQAPPPPVEGPKAPEINEGASGNRLIAANRRGRGSLRIDLDTGVGGADGAGLNVPKKGAP